MLKKRYSSEDDIPEAHKTLYREQDGNWVLDIEDDDKGRVSEFRQKNIELAKEREALQARLAAYGDVDPDTVQRAMSSMSKQQDEQIAGMMKRGEFDKVLEMEKARLAQSHQAQLEALQNERGTFEKKAQTLSGRFGDILLAQKIDATLAQKKLRIHPSARDDLIARARGAFVPNEDVSDIVPKDGVYDGKGKAYTPPSWLDDQVAKAPHLFEGGAGGGAGRGANGAGKTLYNRDDFRTDPEGFAKVASEITAGNASWQE